MKPGRFSTKKEGSCTSYLKVNAGSSRACVTQPHDGEWSPLKIVKKHNNSLAAMPWRVPIGPKAK